MTTFGGPFCGMGFGENVIGFGMIEAPPPPLGAGFNMPLPKGALATILNGCDPQGFVPIRLKAGPTKFPVNPPVVGRHATLISDTELDDSGAKAYVRGSFFA